MSLKTRQSPMNEFGEVDEKSGNVKIGDISRSWLGPVILKDFAENHSRSRLIGERKITSGD